MTHPRGAEPVFPTDGPAIVIAAAPPMSQSAPQAAQQPQHTGLTATGPA